MVIGGVCLEGFTGVPPSSLRETMGQRGGEREEENSGDERNLDQEGEGHDSMARTAF